MDFEARIERLNELIAESKSIVFFGGAGVSTESGIPDFRSKDGLYNTLDVKFEKYSPEFLLSRDCLLHKPEVFFEFYRQKMNCAGIEPNITHKVLAEMEKRGKLSWIITQNIDGLHQKAGSRNVAEIHGTTLKNYCRKCYREIESDYIFTNTEPIPRCPHCQGTVRPAVILYGEQLPESAMNDAANALAESDLIIVGGTSLQVYPAAGLIETWARGTKVVIINRDKTDIDDNCELIFHEDLGKVFERIVF